MTESKRKRIPNLGSREAKGMTTMLFSFEGGDAKGSIIRRRVHRPRRDIVLRGFVSDDLIPRAILYLILCYMGSQCSCLKRSLACSALRDLRMSLSTEFCNCWSELMTLWIACQ